MKKCSCKCSHCVQMGNVPGPKPKPLPDHVLKRLAEMPPIDWE